MKINLQDKTRSKETNKRTTNTSPYILQMCLIIKLLQNCASYTILYKILQIVPHNNKTYRNSSIYGLKSISILKNLASSKNEMLRKYLDGKKKCGFGDDKRQ